MVAFTTTALAVLLGLQQAAATGRGGWGRGRNGGWGKAPSFNCPGNPSQPPPVCSPQQASGWDFSKETYGSFSSYDSMSFSGSWNFTAAFSGFGTRDLEERTRGGRGTCMGSDLQRSPGYSCGEGRSFDAAQFVLVAEKEVDIEMVYSQKGGGSCSQFVRCGRQPQTFKNSQCGGATGVTFKHRGGNKGGCNFGISSVSYASCTSTTTYPVPPPTTAVTTTTSAVTTTTSVPPPPPTTTTTASTDVSTTTVSSVLTTQTVSTVLVTTSNTVTQCDSTVVSCPAASTVVTTGVTTSYTTIPQSVPTTIATVTTLSTTTENMVTTVFVSTTTTVCPVTATQTAGNSTFISTYLTTSYVPVTVTTTTTAVAPPPTSGPGCPDSVPSCLNSWLHMVPQCKDNSDSACFCKAADYTEKIIDCLEAYSGADLSDAIDYFQRICAPYAGENPQPFTGVPSTITITATAPMTTITVQQPGTTATVTVPASSFSIPTAPVSPPTDTAVVPPPSNTDTAVVPPPANTDSTTIAIGTGSFTVGQPTTTSPIAIATGAASKDFVSGAVGFGALMAAVLAF